jgi:hypothetical protein
MSDAIRTKLRALEERLASLERAVTEWPEAPKPPDTAGASAPAPFRIVDAAGRVLVEVASDIDGGLVTVYDSEGRRALVLGCLPKGGFVDILHVASGGGLVVTLEATDNGGRIEVDDANGDLVFIVPPPD